MTRSLFGLEIKIKVVTLVACPAASGRKVC
jgi:hypothetical protein